MSPPENFLLLNRVNAVPGYIDAEVPELEHKAGGPGSLSVLHGEDLGIQSYGSGMFTADKTIAERPDLVRRFVAAYMKGYADVIQDPGAAADSLIRNNPEYKGKKEMLGAAAGRPGLHLLQRPYPRARAGLDRSGAVAGHRHAVQGTGRAGGQLR